MKKHLALALSVVGLLAWWTRPGLAHPLNVYVQAAEIQVSRSLVTLQLRLTPGVNVAAGIVNSIDANGDGLISDAEGAAYAERVRRDLSLTLDGQPATTRLVLSSFAPVGEMRQGLGDILLVYEAAATIGNGSHTIAFENRHAPSTAVYLVNSLQPSDASIQISAQDRSVDQSKYRLDFTMAAPMDVASSSGLFAWFGGGTVLPVVATFFRHGVVHILTGYDHLLFLCALVLGAVTLWDLVKVVTAFTIAHSITLTLAGLSLLHVSDRFVEPMIAASIVFVAVQNVCWPERSRGASRLVIAFLFGLFHGLGFAGGLLEVMHAMPTGTILLSIFGFSLGVEAGNQLVLLPLFGAMRLAKGVRDRAATGVGPLPSVQRIGSAAVSVAGIYYFGAALAAI